MASKLSVDALNIAYGLLRQSEVYQLVGQKIFKGSKPLNFIGECIVVNVLPITKDQLQVCRIMVNVHVPNLTLPIDGKIDKTQPNYPRISELSRPVDILFRDYYTDEYSIRVEQDYIIENEGFNEHYNNFRLIFENINI